MIVPIAALCLLLSAQPQETSWLQSHAINIRSIDPKDRDFSDLEPIGRKIGNATLVVLGENSHSDGATSEAKCRMIRYLHDRLGFDVLAWEAGTLDCEVMNAALRSDMLLYDAKASLMRGGWATSSLSHDAFAFARETWRTERPLEMAGFDSGGRPPLGAGYYLKLAQDLFGSDPGLKVDLKEFETFLKRFIVFLDNKYVARTPSERTQNKACIEQIITHATKNRTLLEARRGKRHVDFALQCLRTLRADEEASWGRDQALSKTDPNGFLTWNRLRDKQMADNVLWLVRNRFAGRKVIVWAATAHFMHHGQQIQSIDFPGMYQKDHYDQAGDYLNRALGRQMYTIAFTAGSGQVGLTFPDVPNSAKYVDDLKPPTRGSFEELCMRLSKPYLYVDLRNEPKDSWMRQRREARPFGYVRNVADWSGVVDAFFFIRNMTPDDSRTRTWVPGNSS